MEKPTFEQAVSLLVEADDRYAVDAYCFLRDTVDVASEEARQKNDGEFRHVRGPEILEAFRKLGLARFGPMAKTVFDEWGVRTCEDVGEMVFVLIDAGIFGKSEEDSLEDFKAIYDFEQAFVEPFKPKARRRS